MFLYMAYVRKVIIVGHAWSKTQMDMFITYENVYIEIMDYQS